MKKSLFLVICLSSLAHAAVVHAKSIAMPPPTRAISEVADISELLSRSQEDGALERIEKILKSGINVNQISARGETPLSIAVRSASSQYENGATEIRKNRYDAVLLLLQYGADVKAKNQDGSTPLHAAAKNNDVNLAYLLLSKGADINAQAISQNSNKEGRTPLQECIPFGPDVFNILLHKGAKYDVVEMLNTITWWHDTGNVYLQHLLARPIEIPSDYKVTVERALSGNPTEGREVLVNIKKHMELMEEAKKAGRPPKLLFKLQPPFPEQLVPPKNDPALITAVRKGDLAQVKALLDNKADVNSVSSVDVKTPSTAALHIALENKLDDIAVLLIDRGANVNLRNAQGVTPLIIAAKNGNSVIIQKLLDKGADVNKPDASNNMRALGATDDIKIMDMLIKRGADVNYKTRFGSLLQQHVTERKSPIITYLIGKGSDINIKNYEDRTPLLNLLYQQSMSHKKEEDVDVKFIQFLVENGANLKAKDRQNFTAYDWAIKIGRKDIAEYLLKAGSETGDKKGAFLDAIHRGDVETVKRILDQGFDANADAYVFAALADSPDYTVRTNNPYAGIPHATEIVRLLVDHGANVKTTGHDGRSVLHVTTDPEMIAFLAAKGVDVNSVDTRRNTPLHVMAAVANVEAVQALLKSGAYPNVHNVDGQGGTPLDLALMGPPDQRPGDGPPPDFEHGSPRYLAVIKLLVEAGADVTEIKKNGLKIQRWGGGDTAQGYKEFEKKALEIIKNSNVPIAGKVAAKPTKIVREIPYNDRSLIFMMIGNQYIGNKYALEASSRAKTSPTLCEMPIFEAVQQFQAKNPDFAKNFGDFLNTLRWDGDLQQTSMMGASPSPDRQFAADYTLLHMAAYYNNPALVKAFITAGANPNSKDSNNNTPLHYAMYGYAVSDQDRLQTLQILLDAGNKINEKNADGETALFTQPEIHEPGGVTNRVSMATGKAAVDPYRVPNLSAMKFLVSKGADVKAQDGNGKTFLDVLTIGKRAIDQIKESDPSRYKDYYDFIAAVKKAGAFSRLASTNAKTGEVEIKHPSYRDALDTPLIAATREGDVSKIEVLLKAGNDINARGYNGETALSTAIQKGALGLIRLLVNKGADLQNGGGSSPNGWDFHGGFSSALTTALNSKKYALAKPLVEMGAKPAPVDVFNMLQQAQASLDQQGKEALQFLIDQGVDPNVCNIQRESLLLAAQKNKNAEAEEILIANGAHNDHCPKDAEYRKSDPQSFLGKVIKSAEISTNGRSIIIDAWQKSVSTCSYAMEVIPNEFRSQLRETKVVNPPAPIPPEDADYAQGVAYFKGTQVPKDDVKAVEYFQRAANLGHAMAQHDLAYMYSVGQGVARDDKKAFEWLKKAVEQGNAMSQDEIGVMYGDGRGVAQDWVQAYRWIAASAKQGNTRAIQDLEYVKARMTPEQITQAQKLIAK